MLSMLGKVFGGILGVSVEVYTKNLSELGL
jgi:hypothetical protein